MTLKIKTIELTVLYEKDTEYANLLSRISDAVSYYKDVLIEEKQSVPTEPQLESSPSESNSQLSS